MRLRLIRCLVLCLVFVGLSQNPAMASNKGIEIYLDGQKVQTNLSPIIMNGRVLLPLRTTFGLFNTPVNWEAKTKTVTATIGDKQLKLTVNQGHALIHHDGLEKTISLDQAPVIVADSVFVPLRFIAENFNAGVKWGAGSKRVSIRSPFIFKNNEWYVTSEYDDTLTSISEYPRRIKQGNITYFVFRVGEPIMGHDTLYSLADDGHAKPIFTTYWIDDFKIEGDNCYYLDQERGFDSVDKLYKVNLSNPLQKSQLGTPSFCYDRRVTIQREEDKIYYSYAATDSSWQVMPKGIYIMAYNRKMGLEGNVIDLQLLEASHGYYLVDKNGQGQKLVENVKVEEVYPACNLR